jgi:peroxiredoxin family protein
MHPELEQYIDQKISEEVARRFKELADGRGEPNRMALVASKGTLDMAYPPLILATTAASLGWEVGIFFTFYGLDILHKDRLGSLKVGPVGNPAMPPPIQALPFLKVPNIVGALPGMTAMATSMMKSWIARAQLPTIPQLMEIATDCGVELYACATTMGLMGIQQSDLLDGAKCAGAAAFLDFASRAKVSMFI